FVLQSSSCSFTARPGWGAGSDGKRQLRSPHGLWKRFWIREVELRTTDSLSNKDGSNREGRGHHRLFPGWLRFQPAPRAEESFCSGRRKRELPRACTANKPSLLVRIAEGSQYGSGSGNAADNPCRSQRQTHRESRIHDKRWADRSIVLRPCRARHKFRCSPDCAA